MPLGTPNGLPGGMADDTDVGPLPNAPPRPAGVGAPVSVRVYQLAGREAFTGADFFRLYNADVLALGLDLVKKEYTRWRQLVQNNKLEAR